MDPKSLNRVTLAFDLADQDMHKLGGMLRLLNRPCNVVVEVIPPKSDRRPVPAPQIEGPEDEDFISETTYHLAMATSKGTKGKKFSRAKLAALIEAYMKVPADEAGDLARRFPKEGVISYYPNRLARLKTVLWNSMEVPTGFVGPRPPMRTSP
jgi:hypothetical protein